jgi:uncharacterized membrane protein YdbT with pleckstrin-like domain
MSISWIPLEEGEAIIATVRRHWWVLLSEAFFITVLAIAPIFFYEGITLLLSRGSLVVESTLALFTFFYSLWLLCLWMTFFLIWTNYYLDVWVITDRQMIDVEQKGLFNREISNLRLDRIQDITIQVKGLLGTLFKFGNVIVQTAGEHKAFIIRDAHYPENVKQVILSHSNKMLDSDQKSGSPKII